MEPTLRRYSETVAALHRRELALHGPTLPALGFTLQSQRKRFEVLAELGPMKNARLLDVGCGLGDFLSFLRDRGETPAAYTGIDLVAEFIDEARRQHPQGEFQVGELFSLNSARTWDFCTASGIFYMPSDGWTDYVQATVSAMLQLCESGIAVNFLSNRSPRPDGRSYYAEPELVLKLLSRPADRRIVLRHDYLPHDFTIYIYKNGGQWRRRF